MLKQGGRGSAALAAIVEVHCPHGRKSKLTKARQQRLLKLLSAGRYVVTACGAVGVNESTYWKWSNARRRAKSRIRSFSSLYG
jgi:hypothetical protein